MSITPRHLLVPVDGSERSLHAAAFAASLCAGSEARLTTLYVVPATSAEMMGMRHLTQAEVELHLEKAAAPVLGKVSELLGSFEGLDQHGELVRFGDPADEILTAVQRLGVDHIVMGSRGLSHLEELLLGSVSEKVVRRASCPVTVVR